MSTDYSIASDTVRKKEKLTKRIRRRLSITPSSKHTAPPRGSPKRAPENSSKGYLESMFGYGSNHNESNNDMDQSEVSDISMDRNGREMTLRRRRKFPSPIPDLGDEKGLVRKIAVAPLKMAAAPLKYAEAPLKMAVAPLKYAAAAIPNSFDVGFPSRGDKSGGSQPELLTQKVAVSDIEKLAQKSGKNTAEERFRVKPDYAYPRVKFNREELRKEANKKSSYFHDLRGNPQSPKVLGSFYLEILQCFGIPRFGDNILRETSAFCLAVCGSSAFQTDVMPPVANPMWLSKMRRACIFPLYDGYATIYIGCFAHQNVSKDLFIGRIAIDVAKLRQGCTYDITLPLRKSAVIYSKEQRGAMRVRFHLDWKNERKVLLSYLPKEKPSFRPLDKVTVKCVDNKAFQNVARVVHGQDIPLKFSMKLVKATLREADFIQIHLTRYTQKRTIRNLRRWEYPLISGFVFCAWMHAVYHATMRYVPGHIITFILLHVCKNYTRYVLDGNYDNGFTAPTWEELAMALVMGEDGRKVIEPMEMERKDQSSTTVQSAILGDENTDGDEVPLQTIAAAFREGVPANERKTLFGNKIFTFVGTEAVDFLVDNGYAFSREEAVELGLSLEKSRLFEHTKRKYPFKDSDLTYVFLNFDTSEYVFKTHKPWFKRWMRLLGFKRVDITPEDAHMEFPFGCGKDHPRFTVKESLVIRSKESRSMLQKENEAGDEDDVHDFGITNYRKHIEMTTPVFPVIPGIPGGHIPNQVLSNMTTPGKKAKPEHSLNIATDHAALAKQLNVESFEDSETNSISFATWDTGIDAPLVTVKQLSKPPSQDIDFEKKDDKKIPDVMAEVRRDLHEKTGNLFNILPYKLSLDGADYDDPRSKAKSKRCKRSRSLSPPRRFLTRRRKNSGELRGRPNLYAAPQEESSTRKLSGRLGALSKTRASKHLDIHGLENLAKRKEEYDRMLQLLRHSHSNVIISKIAAILAPLLDVAQMFLSAFRFSFNLMTWRDPTLTFWFVLLGSALVLFLHFFPWRLFFGVACIAFVGPQNWVMRINRERKHGKEIFDDDKKVTKRRPDNNHYSNDDAACFSSFAPDNRVIRETEIDTSTYMEVAVPATPINSRRFYDWPPEPEYARVVKCTPPENDAVAELLLEQGNFEIFEGDDCHFDDDSVITENRGRNLGKATRKMAKRVIPKKARKAAKRFTVKRLPSVDELDSI